VKEPDKAVMTEFRKRAQAAWAILNAHLAGRRFVVGNALTIAVVRNTSAPRQRRSLMMEKPVHTHAA